MSYGIKDYALCNIIMKEFHVQVHNHCQPYFSHQNIVYHDIRTKLHFENLQKVNPETVETLSARFRNVRMD